MAAIPPKPWPTGKVERPEPLVARVLAPNPSPYTFTGTQTYIVGTGDKVAVIDPGPAVRLREERGELGHLLVSQPVKVAHVTAPFSEP